MRECKANALVQNNICDQAAKLLSPSGKFPTHNNNITDSKQYGQSLYSLCACFSTNSLQTFFAFYFIGSLVVINLPRMY